MKYKKPILIVLVLFLGFWMFTDPTGLASAARNGGSEAWAVTTDVFRGLIRFLGELL